MNKKIRLSVMTLALVIASLLGACNRNPEPCANACGLTAPHGEIMQGAIDYIESTDPMGDTNNFPSP